MKKMALVVLLALVLTAFAVQPAAAAGMPAAHGVDGKTFGMVVSGLAQSDPGALAMHTSGGKSGGMPAAHGVDGQTFGGAVSGLAQSAPGAVAGHTSGK